MTRLIWIVTALLAAAVLAFWALGRRGGATGDGTDAERRQASVAAAEDAVRTYAAFAERLRAAQPAPGPDAVVEGLRRLAAALDALDVGGEELPVDLRVAAEHVRLNPDALATTELVRDRLVAAATALDRRREGEADLRPAAEAIDPKIPLGRQIDRVMRVLVQAAASLEG
jgi:hypothetical protein